MSETALYKFRLYLAGSTPNSVLAKTNLGALCRAYLPGRYKIEIIDVERHPDRALSDGVFYTPCLIKVDPAPARMIVGTLVRTKTLLGALGLAVDEPAPATG